MQAIERFGMSVPNQTEINFPQHLKIVKRHESNLGGKIKKNKKIDKRGTAYAGKGRGQARPADGNFGRCRSTISRLYLMLN